MAEEEESDSVLAMQRSLAAMRVQLAERERDTQRIHERLAATEDAVVALRVLDMLPGHVDALAELFAWWDGTTSPHTLPPLALREDLRTAATEFRRAIGDTVGDEEARTT